MGWWVSVGEETFRGSSDVVSRCVRGTPKVKVLPAKQKKKNLIPILELSEKVITKSVHAIYGYKFT